PPPPPFPTRRSSDLPMSVKSRGAADTRLAPDAPVLGVFDGTTAVAWKLIPRPKDGADTQTVDGKLLLWNGLTTTASAYKPNATRSEEHTSELQSPDH